MPPPSEAALEALIADAREAAGRAYAPYSGFHVGAAVLVADGRVFTGANVENASYGLSICAEANAVMAAVLAGARDIAAVAITGYSAASPETPRLATPCGRCRQIMAEFASSEAVVHVATFIDGADETLKTSVGALLPHSFGPRSF
ncbi:MAG: cytidine deaminase [Pseudomonadota bacterium]